MSGVGGMLEDIVGAVCQALFDSCNLFTDAQHGFTEPVQFCQAFGFRGLYHQGSRHGKGHGGSMKPEIHQPFGNILHLYPGTGFERTHVQDHLVGTTAHGIGVQSPVSPL